MKLEGGLCMRWPTRNCMHHSNHFHGTVSEILDADKWYGLVLFSLIRSVYHFVGANYNVLLFSGKLPHLFIGFTLTGFIFF